MLSKFQRIFLQLRLFTYKGVNTVTSKAAVFWWVR